MDKVWQRADTLSGGEQQRVAIAKILAQDPRVILADEPVASLDVHNGRAVMDTLRRIATGANLTVIATLHHVDYARRYADRIFGLREGRLVFNGPAAELSDTMLVEIFGEFPPPLEPIVEPALDRGAGRMSVATGALSGLLAGPSAQAPPRYSPVRRNLAAMLGLAVILALAAGSSSFGRWSWRATSATSACSSRATCIRRSRTWANTPGSVW